MHDTIQFDLKINNEHVFVSTAAILNGRLTLGITTEDDPIIPISLDLAALKAWLEESDRAMESGNVMYTFWTQPEPIAAAA